MGCGASYVHMYENDILQPVNPNLTVADPPTIQAGPVTFVLGEDQEGVFKWGVADEDFTIKDAGGNPWFRIDGQKQGVFRRKWAGQLEDLQGKPLLFLQPKVDLVGKPYGDYEIFQGEGTDKLVATVDGQKHTAPKFVVTFKNPGQSDSSVHVISQLLSEHPSYHMKYYVFLGSPGTSPLIAKIDYNKKYTISVAPGVDLAFIIALTWSMDQARELWTGID